MSASPPAAPFVGARPFDLVDANIFFGRDREIREMTDVLFGNRLVAVHGPSGVGKSSLLWAGVVPRVVDTGATVLRVGVTTLDLMPAITLENVRGPLENVALPVPPGSFTDGAFARAVTDFLATVGHADRDQYGDVPPVVAVVDHVEEFFDEARFPSEYRSEFLSRLTEVIEGVPQLHVLLGVDDGSLGRLLPLRLGLYGRFAWYRLDSLNQTAATQALVGAFATVGWTFAEGVAETVVASLARRIIVDALGDEKATDTNRVDPTFLQDVGTALWNSVRTEPTRARTITSPQLAELGPPCDWVSLRYRQSVDAVSAAEDLSPAALRNWVFSSFVTDFGTRLAAYQGLTATAGMPNTVPRAFERLGVLRSATSDGLTWYRLAYDGLVHAVRQGVVDSAGGSAADLLRIAELAAADGDLGRARNYALRAADLSDADPRSSAHAESLLGVLSLDESETAPPSRADELLAAAESRLRRASVLFCSLDDTAAVGRVLATLGRVVEARGDVTGAVQELQAAARRVPRDAAIHLQLARTMRRARLRLAAASVYSQVLAVDPDAVDALVERAELRLELGDRNAASADLARAVRTDPRAALRDDVRAMRRRLGEPTSTAPFR